MHYIYRTTNDMTITNLAGNWLESMPDDISRYVMQLVDTPPSMKEFINDVIVFQSPTFTGYIPDDSPLLEWDITNTLDHTFDMDDIIAHCNIQYGDSGVDMDDYVLDCIKKGLDDVEMYEDDDGKLEKMFKYWFPTNLDIYNDLPERLKNRDYNHHKSMIENDRNYVIETIYYRKAREAYDKKFEPKIVSIIDNKIEMRFEKKH